MDLKENLKYLKIHESAVNAVLGMIVVLFSGILLAQYLTKPNKPQTALMNLGDITPNLTAAYPKEENNFVKETPTVKPNPTESPKLNNPENTSSTSTEAETYTVVKGDTLWKISEMKYNSGYNWSDIAEANKLSNPGKIEVGQKLFIPNVNTKIVTSNTVKNSELSNVKSDNPIHENSYVVQKGDNLWSIAVRAYGDGFKWSEISRENKLMHPNIIHSGNVLTIPR